MYIKNIKIKDFRNYEVLDLEFDKNKAITILEEEFDVDIRSKLQQKMIEKNHNSLNSELNFTIKDNYYISIHIYQKKLKYSFCK